MSNFLMLLRTALIAALLVVGALAAAPVSAQDSTPAGEDVTTEAEEIATEAEDAVEEADDGFDDWGLLGLLGLAGLAGLMRRPQPVVHDLDRTVGTGTRVDTTRGPNDTTRV
jgi:MYXO-CTERM domain-containing protein